MITNAPEQLDTFAKNARARAENLQNTNGGRKGETASLCQLAHSAERLAYDIRAHQRLYPTR